MTSKQTEQRLEKRTLAAIEDCYDIIMTAVERGAKKKKLLAKLPMLPAIMITKRIQVILLNGSAKMKEPVEGPIAQSTVTAEEVFKDRNELQQRLISFDLADLLWIIDLTLVDVANTVENQPESS
ncbi:hypothetical protein EC973_003772 [Apophysomyces ossiformis]|uniref:Uncharacterized protein n=1 Tax=Apophysomyces ossiformis TaxID=679940 RepID=A0A8H7BQV6_9FUNG|nr:hypothetical protein EC973_003772 [Apophysomyces ossiformis]